VVVSICSRLVSLFVVDPSPWIVGVRISFKKLRSFTRKPLKRAQQPRLRQRRLVLLHVIEPLLRVIRLSVIREPRSAFRVMNRLWLSLPLVRLVPLDQEIPLVINFTNQRVVRNPRNLCKNEPGWELIMLKFTPWFAGCPQLYKTIDDQFFLGYASCALPANFTSTVGL